VDVIQYMSKHDKLLSPTTVALNLGLQPRTVARWCREGRIEAVKMGRVWRIRTSTMRKMQDGK